MAEFPHCDSNVLHAPGKCKYCDEFPADQQQRVWNGINFTDEYDPEKELCPSMKYRTPDIINKWPGNTPNGYEGS